jgi:hypothetical protein
VKRETSNERAAWTAHIEQRQPAAVKTAPARTMALGRMKAGVMNKTEAAYGRNLELRKHAGEVLWYGFEKMTFKLADDTRYTPDFVLMLSSGQLEAHEVKGTTTKENSAGVKRKAPYFRDDAKTKIKIAAELVPIVFKIVYLVAGEWVEEEV